METQDQGRTRSIAFRTLVVLLLVMLTLQWWVYIAPVLVWFPDHVVNPIFASKVPDFSIHRIHRLALGLSHVAVMIGLIAQLRHPRRNKAGAWMVSGFFLLAIGTNVVAMIGGTRTPPIVFLFLAIGVAIGYLHPTSPLLRLPRPTHRTLAILAGVAAVPLLVHVIAQMGLQVTGSAGDPHWEAGHYQMVAELDLHIILVAFVSASAVTGRRLTTWAAGIMAVLFGLGSVVFPHHVSSVGAAWGVALVMWGAAFIVAGELTGESADDDPRAGMMSAEVAADGA